MTEFRGVNNDEYTNAVKNQLKKKKKNKKEI